VFVLVGLGCLLLFEAPDMLALSFLLSPARRSELSDSFARHIAGVGLLLLFLFFLPKGTID
jgi:hypothetical protein